MIEFNPISIQELEIILNRLVQDSLDSFEFLWIELSHHFCVAKLTDVIVPVVGILHYQLLVRLVCSLAVINTLSSLTKWTNPAHRPYWWIHEYPPTTTNATSLRQYFLTCETTSGFPSSHSMAFTTFVYLVTQCFLTLFSRRFHVNNVIYKLILWSIVTSLSILMWLSRVYLACQFLHQCILSSCISILLLRFFDHYLFKLLCRLNLKFATSLVLVLIVMPVGVYFLMKQQNLDPHWSVRMAFKWCVDPTYLRHEASSIFVLARDLGYLLGVALSSPLWKRYQSNTPFVKRVLVIIMVEVLNRLARQTIPKHHGRLVFVLYEFCRNALHSFLLLSVVSKLHL